MVPCTTYYHLSHATALESIHPFPLRLNQRTDSQIAECKAPGICLLPTRLSCAVMLQPQSTEGLQVPREAWRLQFGQFHKFQIFKCRHTQLVGTTWSKTAFSPNIRSQSSDYLLVTEVQTNGEWSWLLLPSPLVSLQME